MLSEEGVLWVVEDSGVLSEGEVLFLRASSCVPSCDDSCYATRGRSPHTRRGAPGLF